MEKKLLKALFELKKEVGTMTKDSVNPFFKSKYFDINQLLEHVEPLAAKNGLIILQPIIKGFVRTEIHCVQTEEMVYSEIELTGIKDAQKVGSEITYFRRYTLQSLLGIQAEDDDANKAVQPIKQEVKKPFFTEANFEKAKGANATIEMIKKMYSITPVMEQKYKDYVKQ
jgi:hypothetical protein